MAWRISKPLPAVNTAEFNFGPHRYVSQDYVLRWVRNLGVTLDRVAGIMAVNSTEARIVWIKFYRSEDYTKFMAEHEGEHQVIVKVDDRDTAVSACIYPAGMKIRRVTLYGVHFEIQQEDIIEAMSFYGKVASVKREKFAGEAAEGYALDSGKVMVAMEMVTQIPPVVIMGGYEVYVRYVGQPPVCFACRKQGHMAAECDRRKRQQPRDRSNPWGARALPEQSPEQDARREGRKEGNNREDQQPSGVDDQETSNEKEGEGEWQPVLSRKAEREAKKRRDVELQGSRPLVQATGRATGKKSANKKATTQPRPAPEPVREMEREEDLDPLTEGQPNQAIEDASKEARGAPALRREASLHRQQVNVVNLEFPASQVASELGFLSLDSDWALEVPEPDDLQPDQGGETMEVQTNNLKRSRDPDGGDASALSKRGLIDNQEEQS